MPLLSMKPHMSVFLPRGPAIWPQKVLGLQILNYLHGNASKPCYSCSESRLIRNQLLECKLGLLKIVIFNCSFS